MGEKRHEELNNKGQLTVFIILGVAIIIVVIFLVMQRPDILSVFIPKAPIERLEDCSRNSLKEGIETLSLQGGKLNPENFYPYKDNKLDYICYTENSFEKCVMQEPFLKKSFESELEKYVKPKIQKCLDDLKNSQGASFKEPIIDVEIYPDRVQINSEIDLTITKGGKSENYESIRTDKSSKIYDLLIVAGEIANSESQFGDSDTSVLMMSRKWLKAEKLKQGDETKVYILTNRESGEKFMFAIKSIPIPPGWIEVEK